MFRKFSTRHRLHFSARLIAFALVPAALAACTESDIVTRNAGSGETFVPVTEKVLDPGTKSALPSDQTEQALVQSAGEKKKRPNILVILADDVGYSDIGAFGSEIETPNLDRLAKEGRILTNYHTAPLCRVTRSMLISGTDHHLVGQGSQGLRKNDLRRGKPGYEGYLNDKSLSVAQLLNDAGYHTYIAGKWHLGTGLKGTIGQGYTPDQWGFEKSFALRGGTAHDQFIDLNNPGTGYIQNGAYLKPIKQPLAKKDWPYTTDFFTDKLIKYIDKGRKDGKPFFAYLPFTAAHTPLQAPEADVKKYRGKYDSGFDIIREARIEKQKQLGIIPANFVPARPKGRNGGDLLQWESLNKDEKKVYAHYMEIYAGMIDNIDQNVGKIIKYLKEIGEYDNTFIVFHADNGSDSPQIPKDKQEFFAKDPDQFIKSGGIGPHNQSNEFDNTKLYHGPEWGSVSNTPFYGFKGQFSEGGTSSPTIVRLPGVNTIHSPLTQLAHVTDLAPTILDIAGVEQPKESLNIENNSLGENENAGQVLYKGRKVYKMTGTSLLPWLEDAKTGPIHNAPLIDELGSKIVVKTDEWKALWDGQGKSWQFFDIARDRGETTNLIVDSGNVPSVADQKANGIFRQFVKNWQDYRVKNKVVAFGCNWPRKLDQWETSGQSRSLGDCK